MHVIAQYKPSDPASWFFWQAQYLSLSPGHQKALQLSLAASQAASSACQPLQGLLAVLSSHLFGGVFSHSVAAVPGADASLRLCLMSPDSLVLLGKQPEHT